MSDVAQAQDAVTADAVVTGAVDAAVLDDAYADVTRAPLQAGSPAAQSRDRGDLVVVATYDRPAGTTAAQEIALANAGRWLPSSEDFLAVARTGPRGTASIPTCSTVGEFLGAVLAEPPQSLSRVVIIAHSTGGLLGFGGSILADGTVMITRSGGATEPLLGGVDLDAIDGLTTHGQSVLETVRTRWRAGRGEILFFSCGSGAGENLPLMQDFARLIGARARGFSGEIGHCMDHDGKRVILRGKTTLTFKTLNGQPWPDCSTAQLGYRHLQPDRP